jgi:serine/threonine-protein kinase SRPK3
MSLSKYKCSDSNSNTSSSKSSNDSSTEYDSSLSSDEEDAQDSNLQLFGKILGKYNILNELGRGSYSIVWLAYNIEDEKFYAIKVQHHDDYREGLDETKVMKRLPKSCDYLNHLVENFIYTMKINKNKKNRHVCSVYKLHCGNLDHFIRKGDYKKGMPKEKVKIIFKQIISGLDILHRAVKIFHGDIKPDNILLKGINNKDKVIIEFYAKSNFNKRYENSISKYCSTNNITDINDKKKKEIRKKLHYLIVKTIFEELTRSNRLDDTLRYSFDEKYLLNPSVSLSDFGDFCEEDEKFDEEFGTIYYRAPEVILLSECDNKVDIWAAGCTLLELLTGKILFDPKKDRERDRNFYHLYQINKLCGKYSKKFLKSTQFWKKYFTKKGQLKNVRESDSFEFSNWNELLNEYDIEDEDLVDLLENIFIISPNKRISAKKILEHKWLN